jgi:hypothetical protein
MYERISSVPAKKKGEEGTHILRLIPVLAHMPHVRQNIAVES